MDQEVRLVVESLGTPHPSAAETSGEEQEPDPRTGSAVFNSRTPLPHTSFLFVYAY
jgi:hypothetical protein